MADIENFMERLKKIATPTIANALDDIGFNGVMNNLSPAGFGMTMRTQHGRLPRWATRRNDCSRHWQLLQSSA